MIEERTLAELIEEYKRLAGLCNKLRDELKTEEFRRDRIAREILQRKQKAISENNA